MLEFAEALGHHALKARFFGFDLVIGSVLEFGEAVALPVLNLCGRRRSVSDGIKFSSFFVNAVNDDLRGP
jgi:hypothetical protein